jgi:hypothetical protein
MSLNGKILSRTASYIWNGASEDDYILDDLQNSFLQIIYGECLFAAVVNQTH